ncbi:late embryogenesis abundant protein-like protein [Carex littledalei]|uniref:Late embryogenesis abundant protein-like protein n=1 Tax=Carex littledalei TaxID=544730 RepID=A0A833QUX2_9POAL|nr:late embryogenesis abundant protein-like protein [Carex littledalei]
MQAGKNAMETMKEKAANVGASAIAGRDKTKATVEEKVEKVTVQHPAEKQMAEHKKQARIHEAELAKHEAMAYNAAVREHARNTHSSHDHAEEGVAHAGPIGLTTGTARPSAAHQPTVETDFPVDPGVGPYSA